MKIYGIKEVMELSGRSRQTLYKWIKMGLLSNKKIGGRRVFVQSDVDKIVNVRVAMDGKTRWN